MRRSSAGSRDGLDAMILDALRTQLMQPHLVGEFVKAFTEEWNRLQGDRSATKANHQRELETVRRRLSGLIDAMSEEMRAPSLQQKLESWRAGGRLWKPSWRRRLPQHHA